ncbi:MAG: cell wall metabolism sensor histidine kinase WalK [Candidatus Gastranaerophilales bacterium]|nr:cell wall metabolism sensor histidine kinase WalK [Candidatus Gastranaerophilales bacterium]
MSENKSKISLFSMNNQSKTIIIFWFLSSLLIFFTAFVIIGKTQKTISTSYRNFGKMLTQTLASESVDIIKDLPEEEKQVKLEHYSKKLMKDNQEIEYIEYKNNASDVYFSIGEKSDFVNKNSFNIDTPLYLNNKIVGAVHVVFTGKSMTDVSNAARNSIIIIFTIMWFLSLVAVLINTLVITRQISLLSYGVRKISSGEFGYKLQPNDLWGEIKLLFDEFNQMSTKLHEYEEKNIDELTYEKNKLESVLMSIANGVIVCDNFDNVILVNNATATMLNVTAQELYNTNINTYVDSDGNLPFNEHIKEFKDTPLDDMEQEPLIFQMTIDGRVIKALMSPIFTASQEYLGYIIVLHDITKEAEIDKLKTTFISNVSRELRTPVTVLRSYIDTLCNFNNDFDENTKQEFLQIMNQEAKRLNNMVNDILDFSRLESADIKLEKGFLDIKPILENTVNSMKVLAQEKNITFSIIIEPDLPKLYINQDSIERVIKNLISNAVKYSRDNGKIKVRAEIDGTGNNVECSVEDFGIGIPKEHLEKVFDRFYRVETQTHTVKGTGLGLHLVKVAIEKHHNGEVFAESELNKGSKFGFI